MSEYFGGASCLKAEKQVRMKGLVPLFAFARFQVGRLASRPNAKTSVFVRDMPADARLTCFKGVVLRDAKKKKRRFL